VVKIKENGMGGACRMYVGRNKAYKFNIKKTLKEEAIL